MQRQVQAFMTALLMLLCICSISFAAPVPNTWTGSGPFATGLGNKVITALAVSPDGSTVYAGTMSGTVLSYVVTPPTATTNAATGVAATSATLNGSVNANNADSTVTFQYGTDTSYGSTVAAVPGTVTGAADTSVSTSVSLAPGTTYHYRVVATSTSGTTYGGDQTFTTLKHNQAITFSSVPTLVVDGTATVGTTTSGASGNPVVFSSKTPSVCTVSGTNNSTVTGIIFGTCTIAANQAGNGTYYDAPEVTQDIPVGKGTQTALSVTGLPAAAYYAQGGIVATSSGGKGTGPISFSHGTSTACSVDAASGAVTITSGTGSCSLTASKGGDSNYNAIVSAAVGITIAKADQGTFSLGGLPATASYNESGIVAVASGGSGTGAVTYSHGSSTACTVNSSTGAVTITKGSGTCTIAATKASDVNFNPITTATATIAVSPATQQVLTVNLPASAVYAQSGIVASTSGGTGTGAVTFSHGSSTACTINASTGAVTIASGTGTCVITATKAADTNYSETTSAPFAVTIGKANQATLTIAGPAGMTYGAADAAITTSGGSGSGLTTFDAGTSTACSIVNGMLHVISATGTCAITATKATDSNYYAETSAAFTVTIGKATQSALSITGPTSVTFGDADAAITTSGGSGGGAVSFNAGGSTACSIVDGKLHVVSATGTCAITATKAADSNYNQATSAPFTISLTKAAQVTLAITGPGSMAFGDADAVIATSGGSGAGAVTFSTGGSDACSIAGGKLHVISGTGTCAITATKAADNDYSQATSAPFGVSINKTAQAALAITGPATATFGAADAAIATSGGSGSGTVTFAAGSSTACSIVAGKLHVISGTGTCTITATKAADNDYTQAVSATFDISIAKAAASISLTPASLNVTYDGTAKAAAATTTPAGLIVNITYDGSTTAPANAGSYAVVATISDANYLGTVTDTLTIAKAGQNITFPSATVTRTYGAADFGAGATGSSGLPLSYQSSDTNVATIDAATGMIHIVGVGTTGTTTITASQAGNGNVNAASATMILNVDKAVITVTADNQSRSVGAADPVFTASYSGFVKGEDAGVIGGTVTFTTDATAGSPQGSYTIAPVVAGLTATNYTFAPVNGTLAVGLASQTIAFNSLEAKTYGAASFDLAATSSSGLPVTFESGNTAVAVINGARVTIVGAGEAVITARQAGNTSYAQATAQQTLTVSKATLTVIADNLSRPYNSANPALTYTVTGFVNGEDASVVSGTPSLATTAVLTSSVGSYPVTLSQGTLAATNYGFAFQSGILAVGLSSQSITFVRLDAKTYGDAAFDLTATSDAGLTPITYESSNPAVAQINGSTVTITGAGTATITARQAGNGSYAPASTQRLLTVDKATLTVTTQNPSRAYAAANPAFTPVYNGFKGSDSEASLQGAPVIATTATTASAPGSYPISVTLGNLFSANYVFAFTDGQLTVTKAAATVSLGSLTQTYDGTARTASATTTPAGLTANVTYDGSATAPTSAGSYAVVATISDANYQGSASGTLTIAKADQTISFNPSATATYGDAPIALTASGGASGNPVTFAVTSGPGSLIGSNLAITGAGTIVVTASQAGNTNYNAATGIQRSITVGKAGATVTLGAFNHAYDGTAKVVTVATTPAGLNVTVTYDGSTTAPTNAGSYSVVATINDANYQGSATGTLTIGATTQAITFGTAPTVYVGTTGTLSATATSGLAVSFTSTTPSVCTVSGSTVTGVATGICTIAADQQGNGNYTAAAQVTQDIPVTVSISLTVSALADGATTTETTQNVSGTVTNPTYLSTLTINGVAVAVTPAGSFSYPVQLVAGSNTITVIATSTVGDVLTDSRTVTLDTTTIQIAIAAPMDNAVVILPYVTVGGAVTTATATTVTCAVNGGTPQAASISGGDFTCTPSLILGMNTIVIIATDGSHSAQAKRTVNYAPTFTLAITDPASDVRTVKSSYTMTGSVADNTTPVTVTVTMDGQTYTPAVASDGSFSQALTFTEGKVYQITVTGTDQNGTTVTVQRNIIYSTPTVTPFTIEDALKALQMAVGVIPPQADLVQRLDVAPLVNGVSAGDGIIDVEDAIVILRIVVGLI